MSKRKENNTTKVKLIYDDQPTLFASLMARFIYTAVAWLVLGFASEPNNNLFVSIALFSAPLLMDYMRFKPKGKIRVLFRNLGIIFSLSWLLVGFLGMIDFLIIEVNQQENEAYIVISKSHLLHFLPGIRLFHFWLSIGISVVVTVIDAFVYKTNLEKDYREELRHTDLVKG